MGVSYSVPMSEYGHPIGYIYIGYIYIQLDKLYIIDESI